MIFLLVLISRQVSSSYWRALTGITGRGAKWEGWRVDGGSCTGVLGTRCSCCAVGAARLLRLEVINFRLLFGVNRGGGHASFRGFWDALSCALA
jgi:hypothetical protein